MGMYTARLILLLVDFIFGLIEIILALRILLKFLGANPSTPFVSWVYNISETLINPFQGIFPSPVIEGRFILDLSAIIALFVYALIAYLISELIRWVNYRSTFYETRVVKK